MNEPETPRDFVKRAALFAGGGAVASVVPRHALGGPGQIAPSEKMNVAGIGIGGMGGANLRNLKSDNIVKTVVTALAGILAACSAFAAEYHVATTGRDGNVGSKSEPFRTVSAAARVAQPGDTVTVHEGVYRERVNPPCGGESDRKRIVYQAAQGEKVVIKGSEIVKGWKKLEHDTWSVSLPASFFGDFNPYSDVIQGEWHFNVGYPRHTGTVYLNGTWMEEAQNKEQACGPVGERPFWIAEVTSDTTTIWAQFKGVDPNTETVEINVRQSVFYPDQMGRNYITVRGFEMRHAATPWSGCMSEEIGLIGTHWSKGWIIENNTISHSMCAGITLGRYDMLKTHGVPRPEATALGYVKSVQLAVENGWSGEQVGSHVVRNNHISHCEKNGIYGSLGGIFSTIENNVICDIAILGWMGGASRAGLKLLAPIDTLIRNNHFYRCGGPGGVWLDWMTQGTRMTGNLLHDNSRDLFVEVNHGPFLVDNNVFLSPGGVTESSGGGAYVHNLFAGRVKLRAEISRETPYHKPHSTQILGLSKVVNDDERFYNNLFTGNLGLSVYDKWSFEKPNLRAFGNVYLAAAKPSAKDRGALAVADFKSVTKLEEKPDGWWLELTVDPAWHSHQKRAIVTTEVLGKAKVPDAPFEQPDGTPYRLDTDYLNKKRSTASPGPFEFSNQKTLRVKVWN